MVEMAARDSDLSAEGRPGGRKFTSGPSSIDVSDAKNPGWGSFALVIVSTLISTYPFYALVTSVQDMDYKYFIPCTKEDPCRFSRLFAGGGLRGTFPDFVEVQNGVSRPLVVDMEHSRAVPVPYGQPVARGDTVLAGYLFGGILYQWPDEKNKAHIHKASMWCIAFFCIDSAKEKFFAMRPSANITHAQSEVEKSTAVGFLKAHPRDATAYDQLKQAFANVNYGNLVVYTLFPLCQSVREMFNFAMISLHGGSLSSGSELLPSASCPDRGGGDAGEGMWPLVPHGRDISDEDYCATDMAKKDVTNPLAHSPAVSGYIACIGGWAMSKIFHDMMLLANWQEKYSLLMGAASLVFAGISVGLGFMTAMGASQVFIAPRGNLHDGEPCACYYRLDDVPMLFMLGTPCLLMWSYLKSLTSIYRALLSGDFLYYQQFKVPYRLVRQNQGWTKASLLLSRLKGTVARSRFEEMPTMSVAYYVALRMLGHWSTQMLLALPTVTAASSIFSKLMVYAGQHLCRGHLVNRAILAMVLMGPPLACFYWFFRNVRKLAGNDKSPHMFVVGLTRDVILRLGTAILMSVPLCRIFSFPGSHDSPAFRSELTVHALLWEVACFPFALDVVRGLLEDSVGCSQVLQAVQVCGTRELCRGNCCSGSCVMYWLLCDPCVLLKWEEESPEVFRMYTLDAMVEQAKRFLRERKGDYIHWRHWEEWRDFLSSRTAGCDPRTAFFKPGQRTSLLATEPKDEETGSAGTHQEDADVRGGSSGSSGPVRIEEKLRRHGNYVALDGAAPVVAEATPEDAPVLLGRSPKPGKEEDTKPTRGKGQSKWRGFQWMRGTTGDLHAAGAGSQDTSQ